MPFGSSTAKALQNLVLRGTAYSPWDPMWVALYTADNGLNTGDHTGEVSGGSYARLEIRGATGRSFNAVSTGYTPVGEYSVNGQTWVWPTATGNWGTITHISLTAAASGNSIVIYHGALVEPRLIQSGGVFRFLAGELKIRHL
jgi:hypothetical protein